MLSIEGRGKGEGGKRRKGERGERGREERANKGIEGMGRQRKDKGDLNQTRTKKGTGMEIQHVTSEENMQIITTLNSN